MVPHTKKMSDQVWPHPSSLEAVNQQLYRPHFLNITPSSAAELPCCDGSYSELEPQPDNSNLQTCDEEESWIMICRAFAPETLAPPLERWEASQTSHDTAVGTSQTQIALVQALSGVVEDPACPSRDREPAVFTPLPPGCQLLLSSMHPGWPTAELSSSTPLVKAPATVKVMVHESKARPQAEPTSNQSSTRIFPKRSAMVEDIPDTDNCSTKKRARTRKPVSKVKERANPVEVPSSNENSTTNINGHQPDYVKAPSPPPPKWTAYPYPLCILYLTSDIRFRLQPLPSFVDLSDTAQKHLKPLFKLYRQHITNSKSLDSFMEGDSEELLRLILTEAAAVEEEVVKCYRYAQETSAVDNEKSWIAAVVGSVENELGWLKGMLSGI